MRKHVIRGGSVAKRAPRAEAVILPEAIDDDGVIMIAVLTQPGHECGRVGILVAGGAERVYVQWEASDFGIRGIVERDDFDGVAMALMYGGEAAHGFCGPATSGADGGDDVKESHDRREKIAGPGGVVGWIVPAWKCDGVRV
jgi:hypothetical protein